MKLTDIFRFKLFERTDPVDMEIVNENFESVEKIFDGLTAEDVGALPTSGGSLTGEVTFEDALCSKKIEGTGISKIVILPRVPYGLVDSTHTTNVYFKELLKWICKNYPSKAGYTFFGDVNPGSTTFAQIRIYNTSEVDENGYPSYATGICPMLQGVVHSFGFNNYTFYFRTLLTNNDVVNNNTTTAAGYALDARQANPNVAGSLAKKIEDHISNIKSAYSANVTTAKSCANNTETAVVSLTIKEAGLYLIHAQATFAKNGNGSRFISLRYSTESSGGLGGQSTAAAPTRVTTVQAFSVGPVQNAGATINLIVKQDSGAALNVNSAWMCAIRLK